MAVPSQVEEWIDQLRSTVKSAQSAITAALIFSAVLFLTLVARYSERLSVTTQASSRATTKQTVDLKLAAFYNKCFSDNYGEDYLADWEAAAKLDSANERQAWVEAKKDDPSLSHYPQEVKLLHTYLEGYQGDINLVSSYLATKSETNRDGGKTYFALSPDERATLVNCLVFSLYAKSDDFAALQKHVREVTQVMRDSGWQPVQQQPGQAHKPDRLAILADNFKPIDSGRFNLKLAPEGNDPGIEYWTPSLLSSIGYDAQHPSPRASETNGYVLLTSEIAEDRTKLSALPETTVNVPILNFEFGLRHVGVITLIGNLMLFGFFSFVLYRMGIITENIRRLTTDKEELAVAQAIVSGFPMISKNSRRWNFGQPILFTLPSVIALAAQFVVWRSLEPKDLGLEGALGNFWFLLAMMFGLYIYGVLLKDGAQDLANHFDVRPCMVGVQCAPKEERSVDSLVRVIVRLSKPVSTTCCSQKPLVVDDLGAAEAKTVEE